MEFLRDNANFIALAAGTLGLLFAVYRLRWVLAQDAGDERMQKIAGAIQKGAQAFMRREYRAVSILVIVVSVILVALSFIPGSRMSAWTAVSFVAGAVASGVAGYVGMYTAVRANVRTAQAASKSLNGGLRVAFTSGTVMGTIVVSLALLGVSGLFILFSNLLPPLEAVSALAGFGFGGTSIAIFARVGGGIYTKAADVGADLVGKTEAGIPEDDPRNPATIADNVGDNVGDVAGMGSDLFESYASSIIAAITLAALGSGIAPDKTLVGQVFPMLVAAVGLVIGIGSTFLVTTKEDATQEMLLGSLRRGVYGASLLVALAVIALGLVFGLGWGVILATLSGLVGGVLIGYFTEYFTADSYSPTKALSARRSTHPSAAAAVRTSRPSATSAWPTWPATGWWRRDRADAAEPRLLDGSARLWRRDARIDLDLEQTDGVGPRSAVGVRRQRGAQGAHREGWAQRENQHGEADQAILIAGEFTDAAGPGERDGQCRGAADRAAGDGVDEDETDEVGHGGASLVGCRTQSRP
ncbi:MAG: hypothetical protein DWB42_07765, partial [Chloroflexi bacterium]|nr:hypothetical protein [Chloroflexota bacterium]